MPQQPLGHFARCSVRIQGLDLQHEGETYGTRLELTHGEILPHKNTCGLPKLKLTTV